MKVGSLLETFDLADAEYAMVRFVPPDGDHEWPPVPEWTYRHWSSWLQQHAMMFGSGWDRKSIDQYLQVDRYKYGLGFRRNDKEAYTWFYLPGPAAIPLHASRVPNILYGGAAGGMKSHSTRWDAYRHCFNIPEYRSILMRRTFEELRRNHIDRLIREVETINKFFDREVMRYLKTDHEIHFPLNNSKMVFGHCQNAGDEERYLGDEYDDFRPDEVATFLESQIVGVQGRLRSIKHGAVGKIQARLIATSNPGGANTLWLKQWFIDKNVPKHKNPRYRPEKFQFIGAHLYDNPFLMDNDGTYTAYEERLFMYSPERRRQLLLGDWTAITGQFFTEFTADTHVARLNIPRGCKIERWVDWGYSPNPGVCHWVACFPDGRLYVFAEWVFNGEGRVLRVAADVAKRIAQITKEEVLPETGGRLSKSIGDPSMFAKDGHTGEAYDETFRRNGVHLQRGDNDRVQGWGRFRHWLQPHPAGGRWLMYHPDCEYAIRTIPSLVHSKNDPEDLDSYGEDHAADADRYGIMARPSPTRYKYSSTPTIPGSVASMIQSFNRSLTRPAGSIA